MVTLAAPARDTALLSPQPGETQAAFALRADRELKSRFPDARARSAAAIQQWAASPAGQLLEQIAATTFPATQFEPVSPRPIFVEHSTTDKHGRPVTYDRQSLEQIAANCNRRILDTGDFSALTSGHTPEQEGISQPSVVGYCGPFYLGIVGNQRPRWAIFCREWHHREDQSQIRKLSRRSVELWTGGPLEQQFFDPIAALGAETPRTDLGLTKFHRRAYRAADGQFVEKYLAAFPSGSSTFVPGGQPGQSQPVRHQAGETVMPLMPEDVQQIVDAIMETKPMKWAASQMEASGEEMAGGNMQPADPTADFDDNEKQQYAAMSPEMRQVYMAGRSAAKKRYEAGGSSGLETPMQAPANTATDPVAGDRYQRLNRENRELKERVAKVETSARHKDRYHRLSELSREFEFELEGEFKDVQDVADADFAKHCDRIVSRYQRKPINDMPDLISPGFEQGKKDRGPSQAEREKYHKKAIDKATRSLGSGQSISYEDALAAVMKEASA